MSWRKIDSVDGIVIEELDGNEYDNILQLNKNNLPEKVINPIGSPLRVVLPLIEDKILQAMNSWNTVSNSLHPYILKGLYDLGFTDPTPIQKGCIPPAIDLGRCVLGAAETGSGKTLAFGIPILQYITNSNLKIKAPVALILSPTRELALQIVDHLKAVIRPFSFSHDTNRINIIPIVGGLSEAKQKRLLSPKKPPHIIVATPGRLWDLIESEVIPRDSFSCKFLVLDEADRMLETGKFKELDDIIAIVKNSKTNSLKENHNNNNNNSSSNNLQILVFSATLPSLSDKLPINLKKKSSNRRPVLSTLLKRLGLRNPITIDLTSISRTTSSLVESCVRCLLSERDTILYYLLNQYPGRTLVFVNMISALRRLTSILETLGVTVLSLHAQMQQRQRIKNLERFAADPLSILVASDVAARGIDIDNVKNVIHYQVPLSSELYVHRCGRTARALRDGNTIVLVTPQELIAYRRICESLEKPDLDEIKINHRILKIFKDRFEVALKLEKMIHLQRKSSQQQTFSKNTLKALDLDEDNNDNDDYQNFDDKFSRRKRKRCSKSEDNEEDLTIDRKRKIQLINLKNELKSLLSIKLPS